MLATPGLEGCVIAAGSVQLMVIVSCGGLHQGALGVVPEDVSTCREELMVKMAWRKQGSTI